MFSLHLHESDRLYNYVLTYLKLFVAGTNSRGKVCPICLKPDTDPLKSFGDMMSLPSDSDDDEGEDRNFQQMLREMAASAAAEAAERNC